MSEALPPRANLEHLKKEAKALLRAQGSKDRKPKLADVQRTIAKKYGFASWAKLKAQVSAAEPVDPLKLAQEAFHKDDAKALRELLRAALCSSDPPSRRAFRWARFQNVPMIDVSGADS